MVKRITTWLTGLTFAAGLRKLMKAATEAAQSEKLALPSPQRRFTFQRDQRKFAFRRQQRRFTLPWQRSTFMLPWQRRAPRTLTFRPLLLGLGLGAALMYLFDARWGNRRALRNQVTDRSHATEDAAGKTARDERNRAVGLVAETQGVGRGGNGSGFRSNGEFGRANWPPAARLLGGLAGTALAAGAFTVSGPARLAGGAVGLGLVARSLTNLPVKRLVGVGAGRRAVDVQKTITINAPVEEVFNFYSNFENFPRFMANVRDVQDLGEGRSHWVVEGPAGVNAQWDARITQFEPDRLIAWRSEDDATVGNAGVVRFEPASNRGTRLTVRMSYNPPAGALGHAVATLFNSNPKQAMDEDLMRLKTLIETGSTSAGGQKVGREEFQIEPAPLRQPFDGPSDDLGGFAGASAGVSRPFAEAGGREIPRSEWVQFCNNFGPQHAGWRAAIETRYHDGSHGTIATNQPLLDLSSEEHDGGFDLRVVLADEVTERLAHMVTGVESLRFESGEDGRPELLHIRSAGGTTTLRFRAPQRGE